LLQRLVAKALAARGEHIDREVALADSQTDQRTGEVAIPPDAMARAIEQPGLVVGFDKPRLNEAQRNGAPICRDGVDEWPKPCSQKTGNAAAIYRRPKCIVRWQGTAKDAVLSRDHFSRAARRH
jgi:hypothetical protein